MHVMYMQRLQPGQDAVLAAQHGCDGVIISNHGGRQLDASRPAIAVLREAVTMLRAQGLYQRISVMMDGGVRRGSDIYKALALGACAVGISRPVLYALAAYGQEVCVCVYAGERKTNPLALVCVWALLCDEKCVFVCAYERVCMRGCLCVYESVNTATYRQCSRCPHV